jgi:hypothetical protein
MLPVEVAHREHVHEPVGQLVRELIQVGRRDTGDGGSLQLGAERAERVDDGGDVGK